MYKHDWCRTTSQIRGREYICMKCARFSKKAFSLQDCKYESRSAAEKYKHKWDQNGTCVKCGRYKQAVTHEFYKIGLWGDGFTRIIPCTYTDDDWIIKEIIE